MVDAVLSSPPAPRKAIDRVALLVGLGFDVNARHGKTALHEAAWKGDLALVELLLRLGADPTVRDESFHATPSGWAGHNRQHHVVAFLDDRAPSG